MDRVGVIVCGGQSRRMGADKNFIRWGNRTLLQQVVDTLGNACDQLVLVAATSTQTLPELQCSVPFQRLEDDRPGAGPAAALATALRWLSCQPEPAMMSQDVNHEVPKRSPPQAANEQAANEQAPSQQGIGGRSVGRRVFLVGNDSPHLEPSIVDCLFHTLTLSVGAWAAVPCDLTLSPPGTAPPSSLLPPATTRKASDRPDRVQPLTACYDAACLPQLEAYLARDERSLKGFLAEIPVAWVPFDSLREWDPTLRSFQNWNSPSDLPPSVLAQNPECQR
jgi:molybdopterin-guanine dinucleotide biosynthesis protein A